MWREKGPDATTLRVWVVPGASREAIIGPVDRMGEDVLKVAVTAPPEGGKANAQVVALLTKKLGLPKSKLSVFQGHRHSQKVILIQSPLSHLKALL